MQLFDHGISAIIYTLLFRNMVSNVFFNLTSRVADAITLISSGPLIVTLYLPCALNSSSFNKASSVNPAVDQYSTSGNCLLKFSCFLNHLLKAGTFLLIHSCTFPASIGVLVALHSANTTRSWWSAFTS